MTKRVQEQPEDERNAVGPAKPSQAQSVDQHGGLVKAVKAPPGKGLEAGFSGAVVGTVMTYLASFISDPETKKFFLLSIPTVSVSAAGGANRILRWQQKRANAKELAAALAASEETLRAQLADPILSAKFKEGALADYEITKVQARKSRMASISMALENQKSLANEGVG